MLMFTIAIVTPHLPFKYSLKAAAIAVLFVVCLSLIIFKISEFNSPEILQKSKYYRLKVPLFILICYLVFQIIPFPIELIKSLSPSMAEIWSYSNAYNLKGRATFSADITSSIWYLITWLSYILIFIMMISYVTKPWQFLFIIFSIFLLGIYQIVFDIVSKYFEINYISSVDTDGHHYRLTGTFIKSNHTSALLNLSIACGGALLVYLLENQKLRRTFLGLSAILFIISGEIFLLYGSIRAGSMGGLLSLMLSIVLVVIFISFRRFSWKVLLIPFAFVVLTVFLLFFFGGREINLSGLTENVSLSGRPLLWYSSLEMWKDFPLFGVGAGAYEWTFPMYQSEHTTNLRVFTAHNDYLQILVELGIIGFTMLTVFLLVYFISVFLALKNEGLHSNLILILMVGVVAFLIQEIVETSFIIPAVSVVFFSLMGLVIALSNIDFESGNS